MRLVALVISACLLAACAPNSTAQATAKHGPTPIAGAPDPTPDPSPTAVLPHIFVIVMENRSYSQAIASSYVSKLAAEYAIATDYHGVSHPSLPNYLALTSGSTWGISDDGYHALPAGGLGGQLTSAGVTWRAYMEGLTSAGCMRSPYPYALKHNPFAYYGGSCPENVVALDALDADLSRDTPSFVWITPGLCHDGHDCAPAEAGPWLEDLVGRIVVSAAWRDHGALFVVWDEGDGQSTAIPLILASPDLDSRRVDTAYDHYSLLAAIEDLFGLPRLGAAKDARPLTDLLPPRTR